MLENVRLTATLPVHPAVRLPFVLCQYPHTRLQIQSQLPKAGEGTNKKGAAETPAVPGDQRDSNP